MSINNTTLLGLAQPVTGQESGVWGDDVNNGTTQLIEVSIVGSNTISYDGNVTLSVSNGSNASSFGSTTTTSTSSGVAQYPTLILTGARTALRTITAPSSSRIYRVINQTTGGYNTIVNGSATTGVSIPPGASATLIWNGSDFQGVSTVVGNLTFTDTNILSSFQTSVNTYSQIVNQNSNSGATASVDFIVANNNTTATTYYGDFGMNSSGFTGSGAFNAANAVYLTSTSGDLALGTTTVNAIHFVINSGTTDAMTINTSGALALNGSYGTSGQVLTSGGSSAVPTWTTVTGTVPSPFTANGVVYASSTSALATGSALTFDGSKFVASGSNEAIRIANTAPYLSFYNSAQTTQYGYIQHTGTDLALVNVQNGAIPFYTNNTERMRLTSAGYLGIGTSSPSYILDAYASGSADVARFKSGQSSGIVHIQDSSGNGIDIYGSTAYGHRIYTNNSQALLLGTNSTTQATLDTSGNLGLGVIPSAWSGIGAIELPHGVAFTANTGSSTPAMYQVTNAYYNGTNWIYKQTAAATQYQQYAGQHQWWNAPSGTAGNPVTFTQAMTLDNSGKLLVGKTSSNSSATGAELQNGVGGNASCVLVADGNSVLILNRLTSTGSIVDIRYSGTSVGSISYNGSATLYNSTSDQRLKTDLGQVTLTNVIDETIVHDFVWKTDGTQSRGVFAQEAHKVIPQAVKVGDDGEEVEDVWAVDYSKYVPDLIVYCQQLNAEIQSLKAEVATLKGA